MKRQRRLMYYHITASYIAVGLYHGPSTIAVATSNWLLSVSTWFWSRIKRSRGGEYLLQVLSLYQNLKALANRLRMR